MKLLFIPDGVSLNMLISFLSEFSFLQTANINTPLKPASRKLSPEWLISNIGTSHDELSQNIVDCSKEWHNEKGAFRLPCRIMPVQ
jgi:hypothetical protein